MKVIYDEYGKITWPCSNCTILEESSDNTCNIEKCIYSKAYRASEEKHQQEADKMDILKEINRKIDRFGLSVIKSCPYLLPCGSCDKRDGELCSQYNGVSI